MKKFLLVLLLGVVALVALGPEPGEAWQRRHFGGPRVFIGVGPVWGWYPPYPYWHYPGYVYSPPPVIVEEPPVYIQPSPPAAAPEGYWYYCQSSQAYYPTVATCAEPWVKVAPRSP